MSDPFPRHLARRALVVGAPAPPTPAGVWSKVVVDAPGKSDPKYLKYIRQQPCRAPLNDHSKCDGPIEAHHWPPRGRGRRGDDRCTVPLCLKHHRYFHDTGRLVPLSPGMTRALFIEIEQELLLDYLDGAYLDGA